MTLTQFGTGEGQVYDFTSTDIIPQSYSDNFSKALTQSQRIPGIDGGRLKYGVRQSREIGKVNASFVLVSSTRSGMDAKRRDLRKIVGFGKTRLFRSHNGVTQWCDARVNNVSYDINIAEHDDLQQSVNIIWHVPDPFWYSIGTESWQWDDGTEWDAENWGGEADAEANVINGSSVEFTINVGGNRYTQPRFVLVGGLTAGDSGNSLFNATIERIEDGAVVDSIGQFNVTSSISVELNTRTKKVTTNGLPPTVATLRERWFILKPGDNTIRVTASSSGGGRLFAYYYERYV